MPLFHVTVEVEIGGSIMTVQQVVDCKNSGEAGNVRVDLQRMLEEGESPALADRRQYVGKIDQMDLVLGDVPQPIPELITDRRGAIRDQKARNG